MSEVVCVGLLIADIFSSPLDEIPAAGELKLTDRFLLSAGGCAANAAACLRRLGRTSAVVGKVGADPLGGFVVSDLERQGIDARYVGTSATHHTSETFILNVQGEDRRYLHYSGANADLHVEDVDAAAIADARVLYVGGYLGLPGLDPHALARLLADAKRQSIITVLDVVVPAGASDLMPRLEPLLPFTDFFLPNDDEAFALTGVRDPRLQAKRLAELNPAGAVVVTRGVKGSLALASGRFIETESYAMSSVDGSGAGDAFTAGLITALLERWPLEKALRFASAIGASCTRAVGCTAGLLSFDEGLELVDGGGLPSPAGLVGECGD